MIAIIKNDDRIYSSIVLAISNEKYYFDKKIIVFDAQYKNIITMELYKKIIDKKHKCTRFKLNCFIIDYDISCYIKRRKWTIISELSKLDKKHSIFDENKTI